MSTSRPFELLTSRTGLAAASVRAAATQGFYLWASNGIVAALGFLTPLAFTHLAAPAEYGRFSLVASIIAIASLTTMPGLNISLTQAAARGFHGALSEVLTVRVRWAGLGVAGLLLVGGWLAGRGDATTGYLLLMIAPILPLIYGADVAQAFLNGIQRFEALSFWMIAAAALPSATVIALLAGGADARAASVGYFGAVAVVNVLSYAWAVGHKSNDRTDPASIGYGKRLTLVSSLGTLQAYVDKVAVGGILGLNAVAVYSVGMLFQQGLKVTWGALQQLYFPKLASRDVALARRLTRTTLLYVWVGFAALTALLMVAAPFIVHLVFGDQYAASITAARVLMIGFIVAIPGAQFEILFRATADERRLYTQRVTYATVDLASAVAGAWLFGLPGALWAGVLAYAVNSVHGYVLDRRR